MRRRTAQFGLVQMKEMEERCVATKCRPLWEQRWQCFWLFYCRMPRCDTAANSNPDAARLLRRARENRTLWEHFPGFTADITVKVDDKQETGAITVKKDGSISTDLKDEKLRDWVDEQVGSVVDHRLPSEPESETPRFADENTTHPLGRLVQIGDPKFESSYRIRDDVITEVNRRDGDQKFTITVLEIDRNPEGKYLPRTFNATFWDAKSGAVTGNSTFLNTWQRMGAFDLPKRVVEIECDPGEHHAKEITLSNLKLNNQSR